MSHDKENCEHLQCIIDKDAEVATYTQNTKRKLQDFNGGTRERQNAAAPVNIIGCEYARPKIRIPLGNITPSALLGESRDDRVSALVRRVTIADEKRINALQRERIAEDEKEKALKRERIAEEKALQRKRNAEAKKEKKEKALKRERIAEEKALQRKRNAEVKKKKALRLAFLEGEKKKKRWRKKINWRL